MARLEIGAPRCGLPLAAIVPPDLGRFASGALLSALADRRLA